MLCRFGPYAIANVLPLGIERPNWDSCSPLQTFHIFSSRHSNAKIKKCFHSSYLLEVNDRIYLWIIPTRQTLVKRPLRKLLHEMMLKKLDEKKDLPVAKIGINQISQRKQDGENLLGHNDRKSKHWSWFSQGHEGHQMHPFVFGFLQKSMDPTVISLHSS